MDDNEGKWVVGAESWEDLLAFDPLGTLADLKPEIEENDVVVNWGYQVRSYDEYRADESSKAVPHSEFILAYPKSALSDGGPVLLALGDTQEMSADELKKRLKEQRATE
ncbi:hypothetical protein [Aeoliella sp.]|uniref:hypothetical protein n=1 Tax=Aeoliella sp. TaxID=2795800 RepID=UPI003CCBAB3E